MSTSQIRWSDLFIFKRSILVAFVIAISLVASAVLGAMVPKMIANLSTTYSNEQDFYNGLKNLGILFIVFYFNLVAYQLCIIKFVKHLMQNTRSLCYDSWINSYDIQTENTMSTEKYSQGEVLARIMSDTEAFRDLLTSGTFRIVIDLFFVISCLISFISLNTVSGIFISVTEIAVAILLVFGSKYMRSIFMNVRTARGEMSRTISNVIGGLKETYYTQNNCYASKKGEKAFDNFLDKQLSSNIWDASYYSLAESLYPLFLALVVFIFPYSQITEAAIIFAIVDLIQRSIGPIKEIASKIANIQRAYTGIIRIREFLEDLNGSYSSNQHHEKRKFVFRKLKVNLNSFKYPSRDKDDESAFSLNNISFTAGIGELIGIAGLSGSGKSTLLNILAGNIIPGDAKIELLCQEKQENNREFPGAGIEDITGYREQVSIISQDSHIFSESLQFNITLKRKEQEGQEDFYIFWKWIEKKIPYLEQWGIKVDTVLSQDLLSLGQKQLISAIRSCYLKKPVVLFDEISSGLDSSLELALREVVLLIQKNSLTIIVTHRLETILESSSILVMDQGKLVTMGKHKELIKSSPLYCKFLEEISQ